MYPDPNTTVQRSKAQLFLVGTVRRSMVLVLASFIRTVWDRICIDFKKLTKSKNIRQYRSGPDKFPTEFSASGRGQMMWILVDPEPRPCQDEFRQAINNELEARWQHRLNKTKFYNGKTRWLSRKMATIRLQSISSRTWHVMTPLIKWLKKRRKG